MSHRLIHGIDHRSILRILVGTIGSLLFILCGQILGSLNRGVDRIERQIDKERRFGVFLDPVGDISPKPLGQMFPFGSVLEVGIFVRRKIRLGMTPGRSTKVDVKTIFGGILAQMPLPCHTSPIAFRLQSLGHRHKFGIENLLILDRNELSVLRLATIRIPHCKDPVSWSIFPGHHAGPRWSTICRARIGVGESHPFLRDSIDIWRLVILRTLAGEVGITQIIGINQDDIGLFSNGQSSAQNVNKCKFLNHS